MILLPAWQFLAALALAGLLEMLIGEPRRWHALVGFGRLAGWLEGRANQGRARRLRGAASCLGLLVLCLLPLLVLLDLAGEWAWIMHGVLLWFALGWRSLLLHLRAIATPLLAGDLPQARLAVARIVSRDCTALNEEGVARAAVESGLENGADAVFASLFWFALFGGAGAALHRLSNTLDAMWGYRNERFNEFGMVAARLDDVLGYLPARLTALSYLLAGNAASGWRCWREQAPRWDSPNAGPVMASGAGALQLRLGGAAVYHGRLEARPVLGCGEPAAAADIVRTCHFLLRALLIWLVALFTLAGGALWLN